VIAEAKRRFALYMNEGTIDQNLRRAIYGIAIREGGKSEYAALKREWKTTTSVDGKEIALSALGRIRDLDLLPDYLELLFNDVATQDMHTGAIVLAGNSTTRPELWKYIQKNFESIRERLGKNMVVLDRFIKQSLINFNDRESANEITVFFEGKDNRGYDRSLKVISDTILGRASYKERDATVLLEWLTAHGYS
jgi:aminopeptidase N